MKQVFYLQKSSRKDKKYMVTMFKNEKQKVVHFGQSGYSDYTKHKDKDRMKRYEKRHKNRENWNKSGIYTAGFWAKWILWNKPTLRDSITSTEKKFNIIIKRSSPPKNLSVKKSLKLRSPRLRSPKPKNEKLYNKVKEEAKTRFKSWPSAYASGWLVKEYKRRGGTYIGKKPINNGLKRWFEEEWINVCKLPEKVPCGRPKTSVTEWKKKYPYCRPSKKITKSTPKIASKFSKSEIKKRCSKKRKNPKKRIL